MEFTEDMSAALKEGMMHNCNIKWILDNASECEDLLGSLNEKLLENDLYRQRKFEKEDSKRYSLSISTLQRALGFKKDSKKFTQTSLKMLAISAGYRNWDHFMSHIVKSDVAYNLNDLNYRIDDIILLKPGTKIKFYLDSHTKSFIVEKGWKVEIKGNDNFPENSLMKMIKTSNDHVYAYTLKAINGVKLRRKVGDLFYAPSFEVNDKGVVLITDPYNWFDEPGQIDLKEQKDYCIL